MTDFFLYAAAFALVLGVLIVVHEFGHYAVARLAGVKVLRFSVGFGRVLWSRRYGRDGTEFSIGAFPIGGYIKMLDEREGAVAPTELQRSFNRQSVWRRMAIVVAGPVANLLLAVVLFWALFFNGTDEFKPILGSPSVSSPAEASGIENGEVVLKVAGVAVRTWQEMRWSLLRSAVEKDVVDLEVINERNEIAVRRLDVRTAKADGWQGDALERLGLVAFRPTIPPIVGTVIPDGPAERAGLRPGDEILTVDETLVSTWQDVVQRVRSSPEVPLAITILRDGESISMTITPQRIVEKGAVFGRIGASVDENGVDLDKLMVRVSYDPLVSLERAISETWEKSVFSLVMIGKMISGEISLRNISGPVTIADYAGQSAKLGLDYYLRFMALVNISLAVLNLLPVPILDGGHLLYYVLEIIRRKPLSDRAMEIGQQAGMALMLMLMALAFYNDVNRLISG
ncbi:MAG: RIP metalloprotease RseP [Propionivibrio sp.]